jgi:hypothetical protein
LPTDLLKETIPFVLRLILNPKLLLILILLGKSTQKLINQIGSPTLMGKKNLLQRFMIDGKGIATSFSIPVRD